MITDAGQITERRIEGADDSSMNSTMTTDAVFQLQHDQLTTTFTSEGNPAQNQLITSSLKMLVPAYSS